MSIIGMIHVLPLPGTPHCNKTFNIQQLVDHACHHASIYVRHGIHGILVENMFDRPYLKSDAGPEITATMTRVCNEVRRIVPEQIPCGVQILAGLNHEALAVALACQFQFIRVEGFVFSHVADEGLMTTACAGPLLRYRRQIDAEHIMVLTDIKKKHCSHSITDDLDLVETAKAAKFFLTDGIIITGRETGDPPTISDIDKINVSLADDDPVPLLIGSGITEQNLSNFFDKNIAAAIVGSHFKHEGKWFNDLLEDRVKSFMFKYNQLQQK
ncbi:BtpA domain containing protein [Euroglyphus maynei]|uniref:BtpA domain containing protein n=1 Tax=Euroglyphus maynei TaxID=6958 RepID=A0A1Y3B8D4_EURMA|nr:BtpA domain containing protein [Euroglyphus maynei]